MSPLTRRVIALSVLYVLALFCAYCAGHTTGLILMGVAWITAYTVAAALLFRSVAVESEALELHEEIRTLQDNARGTRIDWSVLHRELQAELARLEAQPGARIDWSLLRSEATLTEPRISLDSVRALQTRRW